MVHAKYPGSRQGITLWSAAAYYPQQHISIVPLQVNVGLVDQGRFGHRTQDRTIVGVLYGQFSRDYAKSILASGKGNPTHEMLLEVGHRIQMTKYSFIQPDVQWVIRPSGTGRNPNAVVFGAEMGIVF
jgi:porin